MGERVPKPWGHEDIWARTDRYAGKILFVREGKRLSLQYHREKEETIYVIRGRLRVTLERDNGEIVVFDLEPGQSCHILPGRQHRFEAVEECEIVEVSTPELDDVVRISDDYCRVPKPS
jgi:mannose-6-phosphate isomerase-like protein (cupin superfamily)